MRARDTLGLNDYCYACGDKTGDPPGIMACLGMIKTSCACEFEGLEPSEGTLFSKVNRYGY